MYDCKCMTDVYISVDTGPSTADSQHRKKSKRKHSSCQNVDSKTLRKTLSRDSDKQHIKIRRKQRKNVDGDSAPSLEQPVVVTSRSRKKKPGVKKLKHKQMSS